MTLDVYLTVFENKPDRAIKFQQIYDFSVGSRDATLARVKELGGSVLYQAQKTFTNPDRARKFPLEINPIIDEANKTGKLDQTLLQKLF